MLPSDISRLVLGKEEGSMVVKLLSSLSYKVYSSLKVYASAITISIDNACKVRVKKASFSIVPIESQSLNQDFS